MKCPVCGHENKPDAIFCGECGNKLSDSEIQYEPEINDEKRVSYVKIIFAFVLLAVLIFAVFFAGTYFGNRSKSDSTAVSATTEKSSSATEASTQENTSSSNAESADYLAIKSSSDFKTVKTKEGYSFAYASSLYNESDVNENDGYVFYNNNDGSRAAFNREENTYSTYGDAYDNYYNIAENKMYINNEIITNREGGRLIIAGKGKYDELAYYYLVTIEDEYIYTMEIVYPYANEGTELYLHNAYVVDCSYRYFSKSGNTKSVFKTYDEFVKSGAF
jgi:hypothetical protein